MSDAPAPLAATLYRKLFYSSQTHFLLNNLTLQIRDPEIQKLIDVSR